MELVKGIVITKYCEEKNLTLRQRLELMIPVCQAVQHAHQKGIIHRDLKPSNVMIALYDDKPVPKVIDFGVAKAVAQPLTERTLFTGYGSIVGTLEYMSPEQAGLNQVDVDTRSDVYSLGVILYELLTGSTPIDRKRLQDGALLQMLMMIREVEPPTPSSRLTTSETMVTLPHERQMELARLSKLMRGEVDWIVMKALDKDRNRRYETADSFADDIQRYLADEPVRAGPPSASYRLRKFVKRNRGAVLAAAAVLLVLLAGMAGTTWGLVWALNAEKEVRDWYDEAKLQTTEAQAQQGRAVWAEAEAKAEAEDAKKARDEAQRSALAEKGLREQAEKNEQAAKHQIETARHAVVLEQVRRAWEVHDIAQAEELLANVAEPFRKTWETRYLADLCRRKALPLGKDLGIVHCDLAFAGNSPRIVALAGDGVIRTWDTADGWRRSSEKFSTGADPARLSKLMQVSLSRQWQALSRGGRFLAVGYPGFPDSDPRQGVQIWEAKTNPDNAPFKLLKSQPDLHPYHIAFSPDSQRILVQRLPDYLGRVWDIAAGAEKLALHDAVGYAVWTQDGRLAYFGPEGDVKIRNLATGEVKSVTKKGQPPQPSPTNLPNTWSGLAFSKDGKRLVTTPSQGRSVKVWDTVTGQESHTWTDPDQYRDSPGFSAVALSGNGRWMAASAAEYDRDLALSVRVWNIETGQKISLTDRWGADSLAISDDGRYILTRLNNRANIPGRVWDLKASHEKFILDAGHPVQNLAVNHNGDRIVSSGESKGKDLHGKVRVWDGEAGKEKFTIEGRNGFYEFRGLAIAADGKTFYSAGLALRVWDMETGKEKYQSGGEHSYIHCVANAGDGRRVFTAEDDKVRVWDLVNRRHERAFDVDDHEHNWGRIQSLSVSGDGKLLGIVSNNQREIVRIWDAGTGRQLLSIKANAMLHGLAFSPDGQFLVTGGLDYLQVWDIPSGKLRFILKGHTGHVYGVAVTPDGQRIISTSKDGTVRLWDPATGQEMLALKLKSYSTCVAVSGDGHRIVSGGGDGNVTVWEAP